MVHSKTEAKRLFVEKVLTQARIEGVPLSDAERQMLSWSESDPGSVVDPQRPEQLAAEISDEEYEKKVTGLLARRFAAEVAAEPAAGGSVEAGGASASPGRPLHPRDARRGRR